MKNLMCFLLLALISTNSAFSAEQSSHYKAGENFFETIKTLDEQKLLDQITSSFIRQYPELAAYEPIVSDYVLSIINSKTYKEFKIRSYIAFLSEPELVELTRLLSNPTYQKYRKLTPEMLAISANALMQFLYSRQDDLFRTIEEYERENAE